MANVALAFWLHGQKSQRLQWLNGSGYLITVSPWANDLNSLVCKFVTLKNHNDVCDEE
jgi:hypothetical protein